jgi:hypothetical protein
MIFLSSPDSRFCPFFTSCGLNYPWRSWGLLFPLRRSPLGLFSGNSRCDYCFALLVYVRACRSLYGWRVLLPMLSNAVVSCLRIPPSPNRSGYVLHSCSSSSSSSLRIFICFGVGNCVGRLSLCIYPRLYTFYFTLSALGFRPYKDLLSLIFQLLSSLRNTNLTTLS